MFLVYLGGVLISLCILSYTIGRWVDEKDARATENAWGNGILACIFWPIGLPVLIVGAIVMVPVTYFVNLGTKHKDNDAQ